MTRHTVVYDRHCGFCRWALGWILRWDRRRALRPVALQDPEADVLLAGVPDRMASWHLVDGDGRVRSAGVALAPLFRLLPGGLPVAALAGRFPRAAERSYRWVAEHRSWFGKPITEQMKARADALIERRG